MKRNPTTTYWVSYLSQLQITLLASGFPPYLENLEFCHFLFHAWKMPGICSKSGKTWNFNSKPGKNLKFANSMFQASLFKMSFTKIILIYFFVISTLSTQTLIRNQIDFGFHCFYLEITWKIHGILCFTEKWEPCICFNTFQDFYN